MLLCRVIRKLEMVILEAMSASKSTNSFRLEDINTALHGLCDCSGEASEAGQFDRSRAFEKVE
jgi:hypothetical protein